MMALQTPVFQLKTVSLQEALAVAYAAYRINAEMYLKDTRRYSEETNTTTFDNKSLVKLLLAKEVKY
jgi:hypothetical protein